MAKLTGPQIGQLQQDIESAFTPGQLGTLLLTRLDRPLTDFQKVGDTYPDTIMEVILGAEREGWTPELLRAIAAERTNRQDLQVLVAELLAVAAGARPVSHPQPAPSDQIYDRLGSAQWEALTLLKQGAPDALARIEKNLRDVDDAISTFPGDARFHALKGYVLKDVYQSPASRRLLSDAQRRDYLSAARESAEQALHLDPNTAANHNLMGNVLYLEGGYAEAIKEFDIALQLNRDDNYRNIIENDRNLAIKARDKRTPPGR